MVLQDEYTRCHLLAIHVYMWHVLALIYTFTDFRFSYRSANLATSLTCTPQKVLTRQMVSFGVIADIQYADHDDAEPFFPPMRMRYYRHGILHLKRAISEFRHEGAQFMLQLGDLIDGKSRRESTEALQKVLEVFRETQFTAYHTLGNHDLYNFSHQESIAKLIDNSNPNSTNNVAYYSFVVNGFRFISLDCYDVSMLGRSSSDPTYIQGEEHLAINTNSDLNSPTGLEGDNKRFLKYNGALGSDQLEWLKAELEHASSLHENVIVFGTYIIVYYCGVFGIKGVPMKK